MDTRLATTGLIGVAIAVKEFGQSTIKVVRNPSLRGQLCWHLFYNHSFTEATRFIALFMALSFYLVSFLINDCTDFLNNYLILMEGSSDNPGNLDSGGMGQGTPSGSGPNSGGDGPSTEVLGHKDQSGSNEGNSNGGGSNESQPKEEPAIDESKCICCADGVCQHNKTCYDTTDNDPNVSHPEDTSRICCNCKTDHPTYGCDGCDCVQCSDCYHNSGNYNPGKDGFEER